ncbi:MAG TPA: hypothetical protein ENN73_03685, partial [Firmicutes bacterium]|nr:hypothetical protein [Bacillota bacterium]
VEEHILLCWKSSLKKSIKEYTIQLGKESGLTLCSIIIQPYIIGDISGVLFSEEPVSGNGISIEFIKGTPEPLMQGTVIPNLFNPAMETNLYPEYKKKFKLLIKTAEKIKKIFQFNADIEWTFRSGALYILQVRPITAISKKKTDGHIYININVQEVVPETISPLTSKFISKVVDDMFFNIVRHLGVRQLRSPLSKEISGRLYFDYNSFGDILSYLPGFTHNKFLNILGGVKNPELVSIIKSVKFSKINLLIGLINLPNFIIWLMGLNRKRYIEELNAFEKKSDLNCEKEKELSSEDDYLKHINQFLREFHRFSKLLLAYPVKSIFKVDMISTLIKRLYPKKGEEILFNLLRGLGAVESANPGREMIRISHFILEAGLKDKVLSLNEYSEIHSLPDSPNNARLKEMFSNFFLKYGFHSDNELDFAGKRWEEDKIFILNLIKTNLLSPRFHDLYKELENNKNIRKKTLEKIRRKVKYFPVFYFIKSLEESPVIRENTKVIAVKCIANIRKLTLKLGKKLAERNFLNEPEDIFFLDFNELRSLSASNDPSKFIELIEIRKKNLEYYKLNEPPHVFIGDNPVYFKKQNRDDNKTIFKGLPASGGEIISSIKIVKN